MVISYPLTKVKGYFYLTIFVRNGKYHSYKKTSRKNPEVFFGSNASPRLLYVNEPLMYGRLQHHQINAHYHSSKVSDKLHLLSCYSYQSLHHP